MKIIKITAAILATSMALLTMRPIPAKAASKTVSIDMNGDGIKERITFKKSQYDNNYYHLFTVSVNGSRRFSSKDWLYDYNYKFIKLGKKHLLYINPYSDNYDGPMLIYEYRGNKLKKVYDFDSLYGCRWINSINSKNNKIKAMIQDSGAPLIGYSSCYVTLSYRNGRLKPDSSTLQVAGYQDTNIDSTQMKRYSLPVTKSIRIYSDKKCTKYKQTVPKGTRLRVTKRYSTNTKSASFYVTGDGYSGWYSSKDWDYDVMLDGCTGVA